MKVVSGYGVPKHTQEELEKIRNKEAPQDPMQLDTSKMDLTEAAQLEQERLKKQAPE